jgi:hypothetical protein
MRLGFVRTQGAAETLSLITLSLDGRTVKGRGRCFANFLTNWHAVSAAQKAGVVDDELLSENGFALGGREKMKN